MHRTPPTRRSLGMLLWDYSRLNLRPVDRAEARFHAARLMDLTIPLAQVSAGIHDWLADVDRRPVDFFVRMDIIKLARAIPALPA